MLVDTSLSTIVQQGLRRVALQRDAGTRLRCHAERVRCEHAALLCRPLSHQPIPSVANTIMSVRASCWCTFLARGRSALGTSAGFARLGGLMGLDGQRVAIEVVR
jgi:hypothetical protein